MRDECRADGTSCTSIISDGTLTIQPLKANPEAPIDCFYVYPTVSRDTSLNSDTNWGRGEEIWTTFLQAAPLAGQCRLFAPGYRQLTIDGLTANNFLPNDFAYNDVLAAWRTYLEHDNHGRGVILVGHSQGSWTLRKLIANEIDGNPAVRSRLIAAYLAGFSLQVPPGRDVDGDFKNIPLCRSDDQVGCVIAWATYRSTSPPPSNGYFGRSANGTQAACVNPAALAGGSADLLAQMPANRGATITDPIGGAGRDGQWLDARAGSVATPFVLLPGLVSGECVHSNEFTWLKLTIHSSPGPRADDIPGDMTPEWGTHLVDVNVVTGNLQRLIATQGAAWLAAHPLAAPRRHDSVPVTK